MFRFLIVKKRFLEKLYIITKQNQYSDSKITGFYLFLRQVAVNSKVDVRTSRGWQVP